MRQPIVIDPETSYPADTGCDVSPSCLRCPLPQCKHDDPLWYRDFRRRQRDGAIAAKMQELPSRPGNAARVANEVGITERTVFRVLQRQRKLTRDGEGEL